VVRTNSDQNATSPKHLGVHGLILWYKYRIQWWIYWSTSEIHSIALQNYIQGYARATLLWTWSSLFVHMAMLVHLYLLKGSEAALNYTSPLYSTSLSLRHQGTLVSHNIFQAWHIIAATVLHNNNPTNRKFLASSIHIKHITQYLGTLNCRIQSSWLNELARTHVVPPPKWPRTPLSLSCQEHH
jgi:hypothetical protein